MGPPIYWESGDPQSYDTGAHFSISDLRHLKSHQQSIVAYWLVDDHLLAIISVVTNSDFLHGKCLEEVGDTWDRGWRTDDVVCVSMHVLGSESCSPRKVFQGRHFEMGSAWSQICTQMLLVWLEYWTGVIRPLIATIHISHHKSFQSLWLTLYRTTGWAWQDDWGSGAQYKNSFYFGLSETCLVIAES